MKETPVDPLDALLRRGLAQQLDRHVGRAADAFLDATAGAIPSPRQPEQQPSSWRLWWAAPLLAAAAAVAMFAAPMFQTAPTQHRSSPYDIPGPLAQHGSPADGNLATVAPDTADAEGVLASFEPQDVGGIVQWANHDEGVVWLDDETPARKIRRQRLETIQWTDPRDASRVEITVPRDEILLVSSPKL